MKNLRKRLKERKGGCAGKRIAAFVLAAVLAFGVLGSTSAEAATTNVIRQNVSTKAVSCNASSGKLPTSVTTMTGGSKYYFNLQVSSDLKMKKAVLYVKEPGASSYKKVHTETASNYMCYVYYKYTAPKKNGTLKYYWVITWKNGKTKTTSVSSVTVKYSDPWTDFKNDSRWKNGVTWKSSQTPKVSSYSSKGCAAFCADVVKYVYGKSSPRSGTHFSSVSKIQAGDVLVLKNTSTGGSHWIYVYGRSGNKLSVAEGNRSSKVKYSTSDYTISGSYIKCGSTTYKLVDGYHYK